ncbi:MAG: hypothetical protein RMY34_27490 [Aulosira sp. DedQUE10]|nr:hypothetical protein [Aulosira sp. DedQUE10]
MNVPPGIITISEGQKFTVAAKAGGMMSAIATPVINNSAKKIFLDTVVVTANKNKLKFRPNVSKTFTV